MRIYIAKYCNNFDLSKSFLSILLLCVAISNVSAQGIQDENDLQNALSDGARADIIIETSPIFITQTLNLSGQSKSVSGLSGNEPTTTLTGAGDIRILALSGMSAATAQFNNLVFEHNGGSVNGSGGAVNITGTSTFNLENVIFRNNEVSFNTNTQGRGAAIYASSHLTGDFTDTTFENNHASTGSAVFINGNYTGSFDHVKFLNNSSSSNDMDSVKVSGTGAGLQVIGNFTGNILNSRFENNRHYTSEGGAINIRDSFIGDIDQTEFIDNRSNASGAALYIGKDLSGSVTNSTFSGNIAESNLGGGIFAATITGGIDHSDFTANEASYGGAVALINLYQGILIGDLDGGIHSSNFTENIAYENGGAVLLQGRLLNGVEDSTFTGNAAIGTTQVGQGGALWVLGGIYGTISNSQFTGNTAKQMGGAILTTSINDGIVNSIFQENKAGSGGAITATSSGGAYSGNINLIKDSTFLKNSAVADGGALYLSGGSATIEDTDFLSNTAGDHGGAIYKSGTGNLVFHVTEDAKNATMTFSGNTADEMPNAIYLSGGGGFQINTDEGTTLNMRDSVAGNATDTNTIAVAKSGTGTWNLGASNVFTNAGSGKTTFSVNEGALHFYRAGEIENPTTADPSAVVQAGAIHLQGVGSSFTLGSAGNQTVLSVGGGNAISITDNAANPIAATGQGNIAFVNSPTLAFDLQYSDSTASEPMLELKAETVSIDGSIHVDLLSKGVRGTYVLVDKEATGGDSFIVDASVQKKVTLFGEELTGSRAEGIYQINTSDPSKIVLDHFFDNKVINWSAGDGEIWTLFVPDGWVYEDGAQQGQYIFDDIANFNGNGTTDVSVDERGVNVAGMYVSGSEDYAFSGGPIIVNEGETSLQGDAVTGKLVLGKFAHSESGSQTSVLDATFSGTIDFTGMAGANEFENGIDIYSGNLRIADTDQLGTDLSKVNFLSPSNSPNIGTLVIDDSILFDGGGGDEQRIAVGSGNAGRLLVESDVTVDFKNNVSTGQGGAISIDNGSFEVEISERGTVAFENNSATNGINSINVSAAAGNAAFVVNTQGDNALLTMADPMSASADIDGTIEIEKRGSGTWQLSGQNTMTSTGNGKTIFNVSEGTLALQDGTDTAHLQIDGNQSRFALGGSTNNAYLNVRGNNSIKTDGTIAFGDNAFVISSDNSALLSLEASGGLVSDGEVALQVDTTMNGDFAVQTGAFRIADQKTLDVDGKTTIASETTFGIGMRQALETTDMSIENNTTLDILFYDGNYPVTLIVSENAIEGDFSQIKIGGNNLDMSLPKERFINEGTMVQKTYPDQKTILATIGGLVWNNTAPDTAHGYFHVVSSFSLNDILVDNNISTAHFLGWDGKSLTKIGEGTLILMKVNQYTGDTVIDEGTLQITNLEGTGVNSSDKNVINNGNFVLNIGDAESGEYRKVISGTGNLIKDGDGSVTLTQSNLYTGETAIKNGTLQITNLDGTGVNTADKNVVNDGTLVLNIAAAQSGEYRKNISGTGNLLKDGDGDITLTNENSYSGGTRVQNGSLTAMHCMAMGSGCVTVDPNAHLYLNYDENCSHEIEGDGTIHIDGQINFITSHVNHNGNVHVRSGQLNLGTPLSDDFQSGADYHVYDNTTLGGTGSVNSLLVQSGATLAPGHSIGQITTVQNAVFESNSTYSVEVDGAVSYTPNETELSSDRLVADQVSIENGANLDVTVVNAAAVNENREYLIIDSASGIDNIFSNINETGSVKFGFTQDLRGNDLYLVLQQRSTEFAPFLNGLGLWNAQQAADGVDRIVNAGSASQLGSLYDSLAALPVNPQAVSNAFTQLHGEVFASGREATAQMQRRFVRQLPFTDRCVAEQGGISCRSVKNCMNWNRWGTFTGDWLNRQNIGNFSGYELKTAGIAFGMDRNVTNRFFLGAAFGYDNASQKFDSIRSFSKYDIFRAMAYGGYRNGNTYVHGYVGYTKDWQKIRRDINIGDFSATARSRFHDDMLSTGLEIGHRFRLGETRFIPSIGFHYIYLDSPGITETGANGANLHVWRSNYNSLRLPVGTRLKRDIRGKYLCWTPELRAYYVAEVCDDSVVAKTVFASVRSHGFNASSGKWGRNSGRFGAGLNGRITDRLSIRIDYDYEVYEHTDMNEFSVSTSVNW